MSSAEENHDAPKAITLTPILNEIFRPAAKEIGQELGQRVRQGIAKLKELERERNLSHHIERAKAASRFDETVGNDQHITKLTMAKITEFECWVEGAQDVDGDAGAFPLTVWQGWGLILAAEQPPPLRPPVADR